MTWPLKVHPTQNLISKCHIRVCAIPLLHYCSIFVQSNKQLRDDIWSKDNGNALLHNYKSPVSVAVRLYVIVRSIFGINCLSHLNNLWFICNNYKTMAQTFNYAYIGCMHTECIIGNCRNLYWFSLSCQ